MIAGYSREVATGLVQVPMLDGCDFSVTGTRGNGTG
jgi:hypothetical protein